MRVENFTYAPPPPLWPAEQEDLSSSWPYLILERNQENIIEAPFSKKLIQGFRTPFKGRFMKSMCGMLYLRIPLEIVRLVVSFIQPGVKFPNQDPLGSYIRITLPHEIPKIRDIVDIEELEEEFYFSIRECFSISLKGCSEIWFLSIDCPILEKIRMKYGLSARQSPYVLSSVIAIRSQTETLTTSEGFFRISPAVFTC